MNVTFTAATRTSMGLRNLKLQIFNGIRLYRTKSTQKQKESVRRATTTSRDWIVDLGSTHHGTGDERMLQNLSKCKEGYSKHFGPNSELPVVSIGNTVVFPQNSVNGILVQKVEHIPGMIWNLLSVRQLCKYHGYVFLFGQEDVKVFKHLEIAAKPVIQGRKLNSDYVISSETANWIVDSGCTNHYTGDERELHNLSKFRGNRRVVLPDDSKSTIAHIGDTVISTQNSANKVPLHNVLHIPGDENNLISVSQLTDAGYFILFDRKKVKIFEHLEIVEKPEMQGRRLEDQYVMYSEPEPKQNHQLYPERKSTTNNEANAGSIWNLLSLII